MSMQSFKFAAAGACAGLVIAFSAAAPAQAYQCKNSPHQAVGVAPVNAMARIKARKNWESTARSAFGVSWSLWSIAKNRGISCAKLDGGKWRCLASARPCNYVVP